MYQQFYRHGKERKFWQKKQRILLAVSGGIDSMLLLHLMEQVAEKDQVVLGVAHVNHKLRKESDQEATYLSNYCNQKAIEYHEISWVDDNKKKNTEAKARAVRYAFFEQVMLEQNYEVLMTAHHSDDQAETILMKLTRGSSFSNLVGIRSEQLFGNGRLVRPLLLFSKQQLKNFAKQAKVIYFEDSTNQTLDYTRNRIRHQVVPVLKKENTQFLKHIEQFSQQLSFADEIIQSVIAPKYDDWVQEVAEGWCLELSDLRKEKSSLQTFFLITLLQRTLIPKGVSVNQQQFNLLLEIINQEKPQLSVDFEQDWQFEKVYNRVYLTKKTNKIETCQFQLTLHDGFFLSETEWVGLENVEKAIAIPSEIKHWHEDALEIPARISLPLMIRHRENGDRIQLTNQLTKRVNRWFIDKKVPNATREKSWLVLSEEKEIISILGFVNSYLSIPQETDKILYRLIYKTMN